MEQGADLKGAAHGGVEEGEPGHGVIEGGDGVGVSLAEEGRLLPVAGKLGIVPVEAADLVCRESTIRLGLGTALGDPEGITHFLPMNNNDPIRQLA